ncbi:MAG: glycerophosphodiester phosphodiesterase [Longimicrobiales bacterium]|nr:glycerophosphodiester phosphodiesterase [Longimicrobiales bacterium]
MGLWPGARPGHPYLAGPPLLVAHRGGAGVAPENTLPAFRNALERYGSDMLELDVHLSADGEVVVIHDDTVDRTTDGTGAVAAMSLSQLREFDAGHRFRDPEGTPGFRGQGVRIPLFREVLEAFPGARLNVECKCARVAGPLVALIRRHGAEHRVLLAAAEESNRRAVRGYRGPWGASRAQLRRFYLLHRLPGGHLYTPAADTLQIPEWWRGRRILTPRFLREAHRRNLPVQVWTVDDADDMTRLLRMGVDGIQTDRPDRLAQVLHRETGRPLPPDLLPPAFPPGVPLPPGAVDG